MDAYKMALRLNPEDEEARYNLAVVQKMIQDRNRSRIRTTGTIRRISSRIRSNRSKRRPKRPRSGETAGATGGTGTDVKR